MKEYIEKAKQFVIDQYTNNYKFRLAVYFFAAFVVIAALGKIL